VGKIAPSFRRCRLMTVATPVETLLSPTWLSNPRRLEGRPPAPPEFLRWQFPYRILSSSDLGTRSQCGLVQLGFTIWILPLQRTASRRVRLLFFYFSPASPVVPLRAC